MFVANWLRVGEECASQELRFTIIRPLALHEIHPEAMIIALYLIFFSSSSLMTLLLPWSSAVQSWRLILWVCLAFAVHTPWKSLSLSFFRVIATIAWASLKPLPPPPNSISSLRFPLSLHPHYSSSFTSIPLTLPSLPHDPSQFYCFYWVGMSS